MTLATFSATVSGLFSVISATRTRRGYVATTACGLEVAYEHGRWFVEGSWALDFASGSTLAEALENHFRHARRAA